jgi:hypothetical protein
MQVGRAIEIGDVDERALDLIPRIEDGQTRSGKIFLIASYKRKRMLKGNSGDE